MKEHIFDEIMRLRELYRTSDPFELIDALGIHLWLRYDMKSMKGFYAIQSGERYIVINKNLNARDRRLVAAHELGHDRLHQSFARVEPLRDFMLYDMSSRAEYQANQFAAELLISDHDVESMAAEGMDYLQMCQGLGYNPQLVCFKLYSMIQRGYNFSMPDNLHSDFLAR